MYPVTAPGNLAGRFTEGDPTNGQRRTALAADDFNRVWNELETLVVGAGLSLNVLDETQVLQAVQRITRGRTSLRNALINGDFRFVQRFGVNGAVVGGTALNNTSAYVLDRWISDTGDAGAATVKRVMLASGTAPGAGRQIVLHSQTTPSSLTRRPSIAQRIEGVDTYAGRTAVLSFWAKTNLGAGSGTIIPKLTQNFGTGSGTSPVTLTGSAITISSVAYTRYSSTFALAAVPSGALTYSFQGDDFLEVKLELPHLLNFDMHITDVQLEIDALSDFERRNQALEWMLNARYFEKTYEIDIAPGTATAGSARRGLAQGAVADCLATRFLVPKRVTPTVAWWSSTGLANNVNWGGADVAKTGGLPSQVNSGYVQVGAAQALGSVIGHFTADAEL